MTTTSRKVAKPSQGSVLLPKKRKRFSFLRELAHEMRRLTSRTWDPAYLCNLVSGTRLNRKLEEDGTLAKAISNLAAKGITQGGKG